MRKYHQGFISIQWLAILIVIGVIMLCAARMVPVYIENIYVTDALKFVLSSNVDIHDLDKSEIKSQLGKYMTINAIGSVQSGSFQVHKTQKATYVNSVYEVRVPIIHNIDAVMSFKNQLDSSNPEACCKYLVDNWDDK